MSKTEVQIVGSYALVSSQWGVRITQGADHARPGATVHVRSRGGLLVEELGQLYGRDERGRPLFYLAVRGSQ